MKISKFLISIVFLTVFSLLYVYQQNEIFRLAYTGQKKQVIADDLLDKNSILRYNIKRNTSLVCIGTKISGSADFQMPDSYRLVKLSASTELGVSGVFSSGAQTFFSRIFGIKRQAVAKTVNDSTSLTINPERSQRINP